MMAKMKKMIVSLIAVTVLAVPQLSAQQPVAAKYVDKDGFALTVNDSGYMLRWLEDLYTAGTAKLPADPVFNVVREIIREVWNENKIARIGSTALSGKEIAPDFYTVKAFTEMPAENRTCSLWKIMQGGQALSFIDVMPKNTLAAVGFDLNGAALFAAIEQYINKFGNQDVKEGYKVFLAEGIQNGVDVKKLANSVQGVALCIEADPARQIAPGYSSATLFLSVKDSTLMDAIVNVMKQENPEIVTNNNELMIPTPVGAVAVFQQGNYIVVTTDFANVKNLIAGKAPSLKQNPDYIRYSAGTPAKGDAFLFVSSELGKSVIPAWLPAIPAEVTQNLDVPALCKVIGIGTALYSVNYTNQEGLGSICNTGSKGIAILTGNPSAGAMLNSLAIALIGYWDQQKWGSDTKDLDGSESE